MEINRLVVIIKLLILSIKLKPHPQLLMQNRPSVPHNLTSLPKSGEPEQFHLGRKLLARASEKREEFGFG